MNVPDIGSYFREMRKRKNLTQANVAEKLNISPQAVSKWERGECLPDISLLNDIAEIYGVDVGTLLNAGNIKEPDDVSEFLKTATAYVSDNLFSRIYEEFSLAGNISDVDVPTDILMFLREEQKDLLLDLIFRMEGLESAVHEIFRYTSTAQRERLIKNTAERGDYENLEALIPYMSKKVRTYVLELLLEREEFEFMEEMLPFLNRAQRDIIINYYRRNYYEQRENESS